MAQSKYLLKGLRLGEVELRNRVVLAPLTRGRADVERREATELMAEYYRQRASGGLLISEGVGISEEGYGWIGSPGMYTKSQGKSWKKVTEGVQKEGGLIFMQLWHMGRQSHSSFRADKSAPVSASRIAASGMTTEASGKKVPYEEPRELETWEISRVVKDFGKAAKMGMEEGGFDGVEIHGANGYLIDQFMQSCSNKRQDKYGGSMENRVRLLEEIIEEIKMQGISGNRIGVKVSPNGVFGSMGSEDNDKLFPYVAEKMKSHQIGYLHVMDGLGFGFHGKCGAVNLHEMKRKFEGVVIGNVGYEPETAEGAIRTGAVDAVAFGRRYMSNPDLVARIKNNHPLAELPPMTNWYAGGATGYTSYPPYSAL